MRKVFAQFLVLTLLFLLMGVLAAVMVSSAGRVPLSVPQFALITLLPCALLWSNFEWAVESEGTRLAMRDKLMVVAIAILAGFTAGLIKEGILDAF